MKTRFLIKNSLDKKVKSKWFKIVNIICPRILRSFW